MKKRSFSLIEFLVALPLIAILFSSVLHLFFSQVYLHKKTFQSHHKTLERLYFQKRFQQILNRCYKKKQRQDFFGKKELQFYFNNEDAKNLSLQKTVFSKLFLDETSKELRFELFQHQTPLKALRSEKFLSNVDQINMQYFFEEPKKYGYQQIETENISKPERWVLLKITVTQKKQTKDYFFTLKRPRSIL